MVYFILLVQVPVPNYVMRAVTYLTVEPLEQLLGLKWVEDLTESKYNVVNPYKTNFYGTDM
jgi:hypothetical protein